MRQTRLRCTTIRRGAEIFGLGLLFRVQEFVLGQPWAPWTDLLRVDVLNVIGISLMLMGAVNWLARTRAANVILAAAVALGISLATPPLWTTWRPRWLPWYLESYINGVHTFNVPQAVALPDLSLDGVCFRGAGRRLSAVQRMAGKKSRTRDGDFRRGWRWNILSVVMVRRAAGASLRRVRLLAHQPEFFPRARGSPAAHHLGRLRVVPLGPRASSDSVR